MAQASGQLWEHMTATEFLIDIDFWALVGDINIGLYKYQLRIIGYHYSAVKRYMGVCIVQCLLAVYRGLHIVVYFNEAEARFVLLCRVSLYNLS